MINVLRILGPTAFNVNLTAARRMILTTIGPIEELATRRQCASGLVEKLRGLRLGDETIVTWELSHAQTDGDHALYLYT